VNPKPPANLTRKQAQILDFLREYVAEHGISPTLDEIAAHLKVHRVTVFEHVQQLERRGRIRTERYKSRSIQLVEVAAAAGATTLPLVGRIAAGRPIEAIEDAEAFDLLDLIPRDKPCFLLRVQGDSMIEDQIRDGDIVIIESRSTARPGETVVALLRGEEATLKRFYPQGAQVRLEPRNAALAPIVVDAAEVQVRGVVVGVIRKY
jgi:repressor LexA